MCNNIITKAPTTPQVRRYTLPCEMSSVFKATIENKTTSVTTHLKNYSDDCLVEACLLSQLLSKVTHILQFLHQMFNLFALLWDDLLKPATQLTNSAIDETMQ